ncbi:MAG TPA: hypothetical protein VLF90_00385 [Patescibacteria group bacterium]|nr:hypothetical protein [Patescibacteria group bacterium]
MLQKQLDNVLTKPMDRREFLVHIAYGALLITGISSLLKGLSSYSYNPAHSSSRQTHQSKHGFGASKFGE